MSLFKTTLFKSFKSHVLGIVFISLMSLILVIIFTFYNVLPMPIELDPKKKSDVYLALQILQCPTDKLDAISKAITHASQLTDISPLLIATLLKTESNFNPKAVSTANYKGLMQTPTATYEFADVDVLHGARILQQKLRMSGGDLKQALIYYKGGVTPQGIIIATGQANEVIQRLESLKTKLDIVRRKNDTNKFNSNKFASK